VRKANQGAKADMNAETLAKAGVKTEQDFHDAAKDQGLWKEREYEEGDLGVEFNDAAEIGRRAEHDDDDGDDDRARSWKNRAEARGRGVGPRRSRKRERGKGYGYRRDE
jgi:hypothetical protein